MAWDMTRPRGVSLALRRYAVGPGALCQWSTIRSLLHEANHYGDEVTQEQRTLKQLLSPARMAPYLASTTGSWQDAIELYDWNSLASAAFFESLHYLEVGLRNVLDEEATRQFGSTWLSIDSGLLTPRSQKVVQSALRQAGGMGAPHGKVLAELPFGFWWSLLADEYNRRLWQPAFQHAFEGSVRRRRLHAQLDDLRRLRNRIAHHEPIHARDLEADFSRIIDVATRIGGALARHIDATSRVPDVLAHRHPRS